MSITQTRPPDLFFSTPLPKASFRLTSLADFFLHESDEPTANLVLFRQPGFRLKGHYYCKKTTQEKMRHPTYHPLS